MASTATMTAEESIHTDSKSLDKGLLFDLLTPVGVLAHGVRCDEINVPLASGEITILPGHEKFLAILGTGILTLKMGKKIERFLVAHGLCKIDQNKVTLLVTTAETAHKVDLDRAKLALKKAQDHLENHQTLDDKLVTKYQRKLARAESRIRLAYLRE